MGRRSRRIDNCPQTPNAAQEDLDGDGQGDACDVDRDGDGYPNSDDICPDLAEKPNDGPFGDTCDDDIDGDGVENLDDNCPRFSNERQGDQDADGTGDVCEDTDDDGLINGRDNCPNIANPEQVDRDDDRVGDACDETPIEDYDEDGIADADDNCPHVANSRQRDSDGDYDGDACDPTPFPDGDADGVGDPDDNCPETANPEQSDGDMDGTGDACDPDTPPPDAGDARDISAGANAGAGCAAAGGSTPVEPMAWLLIIALGAALVRNLTTREGARCKPGDAMRKRPTVFPIERVLFVAVFVGFASCTTPEPDYEPRTLEGNQCLNQCRDNYNSCRMPAYYGGNGNTWSIPASGRTAKQCAERRNECIERCKRLEGREIAASSARESRSRGTSGATGATEPTPLDIERCWKSTTCGSNDRCGRHGHCDVQKGRCYNWKCVQASAMELADRIEGTGGAVGARIASAPESSRPADGADADSRNDRASEATAESDSASSESESTAKTASSPTPTSEPDQPDTEDQSAPDEPPRTMSVAQAARVCGVKPATVEAWITSDKLKAVAVGDGYRISRTELERTWRRLGGGDLFDSSSD